MRSTELKRSTFRSVDLETSDGCLLSLQQAADYLGMSISGLRKMIRGRVVRFFQPSKHGRIRFRREWLDDLIEMNSTALISAKPVESRRCKTTTAPIKFDEKSHGLDYRAIASKRLYIIGCSVVPRQGPAKDSSGSRPLHGGEVACSPRKHRRC